MIKLEYTQTFNWEGAIRGMRNPMNSWEMSDSPLGYAYGAIHTFKIGENDLDLAKRLAKAGSDHRKYMRQIIVSVDITAPLYWWKEFDTYKVGTTANSCSTMHKIHSKAFEVEDFSCEHLFENQPVPTTVLSPMQFLSGIIRALNCCQEMYLETKDKAWWWQMIQLLPSSYNQKRTVTMNYENLVKMYHARKNHKLDEWHKFCEWIESLPYSEIITGVKG